MWGSRRWARGRVPDGARRRAAAVVLLAAVSVTAGVALATTPVPDATTLLSRPDGTAAVPAPGTGSSGFVTATGISSAPGGELSSDNGRFVVFVSDADDMSTEDDDDVESVYVRDTVAGTTTLVSRATGASGAPADEDAKFPAISDDGTKVAFLTAARLDPADTDALDTVYLRDLTAQTTTVVSAPNGTSTPTGLLCPGFSVDDDGSHVAFATFAAIDGADSGSECDIYVRDVAAQTSELGSPVGSSANNPSLSDDGRTVAFTTFTSLTGADGDGLADVYVHDLDGPTTVLASRATGASGTVADQIALVPRLGGDGTRVAFQTFAALDAADTNAGQDVYVRDVTTDTTIRASLDAGGAQFASSSADPAIADDGTRVAFRTGTDGTIRVRSLGGSPTTVVVSRADGPAGDTVGTANADVGISGNGRTVSFAIDDDGISPDDDDTFRHVYQRRLPDHPNPDTTILVDRPTGTGPFPGPSSQVADATIRDRSTSWDGRFTAFATDSDHVAGAVDQVNVLVRDVVADTTEQANLAADSAAVPDAPGDQPAFDATISARGDRVAFLSSADNLHPDAATPSVRAFLRDRTTGDTELVSRADGAAGTPAGAQEVEISPDGRRAAFVTTSALDPADTNGVADVYVREFATGRTFLASVAADGTVGGAASTAPSLDWDGSRVAFQTDATNLTPVADGNGSTDVVVRDLDAGTTVLASRGDGVGGAIGDDDSTSPSLDGDGTRVAFTSRAPSFGVIAANAVIVRDTTAGTTTNLTPTANSNRASISDDGTRVVLETLSPLGGGADDNGELDAYRVDVASTAATLLSRASTTGGDVGNLDSSSDDINGDGGPSIAGSGACAVFGSRSSNLDPDWVGSSIRQVYLRAVGGCTGVDVSAPTTTITGPVGGSPTADSTPTLSFTADERATFVCSVDGGAPFACRSPLTTAALPDGAHTLSVGATDPVGNAGPTSNRGFEIDTTGPSTTITAGPTGGAQSGSPATFAFAAESGATFSCRVDGAPFAACTSPFTTGTLAPGAHTFEVRAQDTLGNEGPVAQAAFTVPSPPAPPAAPGTPAPAVTPTPAPTVKEPAKIRVLRAGIKDGKLDMLIETTSRATGKIEVEYESSGRKHRFDVSLSTARSARGPKARAAESRIKVLERLPSAQRRKTTGIVTLTYAGNATVRPDEVRLRAATNKALLTRGTTRIDSSGRLVVDGTISSRAVGVVRVRLGYVTGAGEVAFKTYNARIRTKKGSSRKVWAISEKLPADAAKSGGQLSIQFTGYEPRLIRGEQTAKQVVPA